MCENPIGGSCGEAASTLTGLGWLDALDLGI